MSNQMPMKLKVLTGVFIGAAGLSAVGGHWFSAAVDTAIVYALIKGSDRSRRIIVGVTILHLVFGTLLLVMRATASVMWFVALALLLAFSLLSFWCMLAPDVREWMSKPRPNPLDVS